MTAGNVSFGIFASWEFKLVDIVIVGLFVGGSAFFVIRHVLRAFSRDKHGGCNRCTDSQTCSVAGKSSKSG